MHNIEHLPPSTLKFLEGSPRRHTKKQIKKIAESIQEFGWTNPILVGDDLTIISGHGRVEAAKLLGLNAVPVLRLSHLSHAQRIAYNLTDNQTALIADWNGDLLANQFQALTDLDFDLALTGFSQAEIDFTLDAAKARIPKQTGCDADHIPQLAKHAVTRRGEVWELGRHRLICGDARDFGDYATLLRRERADIVFADAPYNQKIAGNVTGLGRFHHREFAMASGEMSPTEFTHFLTASFALLNAYSRNGAIAYICMDWRHLVEAMSAGAVFSELKNLIVWNKTNGGMGSFYRSKHELILVFKVGDAPHTNNFGLGDTGRPRTNVWDYPGISSATADRTKSLEMHPTVKPVALVADALKDCSRRGDMVLDAFGGSGTTLIAAESCGRIARLIEIDPLYCDTIVRRFEAFTGKAARLAGTDFTFEDIQAQRIGDAK